MDIIIGRDHPTQRLCLKVEGKQTFAGNPGSVPITVSREHCKLTISDDTIRITNLKPENYTYVNGQSVNGKNITRGDKVQLGPDRYTLDWSVLDSVIPKVVDVRQLEDVWNDYNTETRRVKNKIQRFQTIQKIVPAITMSAVLLSVISGGKGNLFYFLYAFVIILTLYFFAKSWRDIYINERILDEIKERFTQNYCCPVCGYFFGYQEFKILMRNMDNCPKCRTKLRK